jgi:ubiquinone/menaquinone biosynthesis C-methylase UbiE
MNNKVKEFYEKNIKLYENERILTKLYLFYKILLVNKKGSYDNVLDVGCATGKFLNLVNAKNKIGIDVSGKVLIIAKKKHKKINFVIASAEFLPFKNEVFDLVTCFDVLEHVSNQKKVLLEIYRVAKKDCKVIITTPNPSYTSILKILEKMKMKFPEGLSNYLTPDRIKGLLPNFSKFDVKSIFGLELLIEAIK